MLVRHVQLEPFRGLTRITNRPHAAVELAGDVFDVGLAVFFNRDIAEDPVMEPELLRKEREDLVIDLGLKERVHDLVTPLQ